jgi:hypothetical protein
VYPNGRIDDEKPYVGTEPASAGPTLFVTANAPAILGRAVRLVETGSVLPASCACCGALAARSRLERSAYEQSLLIPYCDECQRHASAVSTRTLSVALSSLLLGLTLAAVLPLLLPQMPITNAAMIAAGAALPIGAALLLKGKPRAGHSATGRAAWWLPNHELACTSPRWAAELALANGADVRSVALREPKLSPLMFSGLAIALFLAPALYRLQHPLVRVLNLTDERVDVFLDGRMLATVEPTSAESQSAGVEVRMPAGRHRVVLARPDGRRVADEEIRLESGSRHLYAAGSGRDCFWIERTGYGRSKAKSSVELLERDRHFWVLPDSIDTWFASNPPPASGDERSTGGVLSALRQTPCSQAPVESRPNDPGRK